MGNLSGKKAVVTGGSRGIGAGIVRSLASAGADICSAASREGRAAVRHHWEQQWAAADPTLEILELREKPDEISARVRLSTRDDRKGQELENELHFTEGLIGSMRIRKV